MLKYFSALQTPIENVENLFSAFKELLWGIKLHPEMVTTAAGKWEKAGDTESKAFLHLQPNHMSYYQVKHSAPSSYEGCRSRCD